MSRWTADNADQVAEFLGLRSRRQIQEYLSRGCPGKQAGVYDLAAITAWCHENVWTAKQTGSMGDRKSAAEVRKLEAEAFLREVRAKREIGELIDRAAVLFEVRKMVSLVRERLMSLPPKIVEVVPTEVRLDTEIAIENVVRQVLIDMANTAAKYTKPTKPKASSKRKAKHVQC